MNRIKKNDKVVVISGKDKGKRGLVLAIALKKGKVKIEGVGVVSRHYKARRRGEEPSIKRQESFIDISKVMLIDAKGDSPCRVGFVINEQGTKVRINKRTQSHLV
jgi:large subunit ribosomal protein L24